MWCLLFNSLRPIDPIWWHRSEATLAQVIACCLTEPSHFLNRCWIQINEVHWHSLEDDFSTVIYLCRQLLNLAWKLLIQNELTSDLCSNVIAMCVLSCHIAWCYMENRFELLGAWGCGSNFKVFFKLIYELITKGFHVKLVLDECHRTRTPLIIHQQYCT